MGRLMLVVVVFLLGVVFRTNSAEAAECMNVISNVFECSNFLKNPNLSALPESSCCNAARNLIGLGDPDTLCQCFQPVTGPFLPSKAQLLPGLCNLDNTFLPIAKCLGRGLILTFPVPPLPTLPDPPLPYIPPAAEQLVKAGLQPPLPLVPLPPLLLVPPVGPLPLPPLPLIPPVGPLPLPPLPLVPPVGPFPPLPLVPLPPLPLVPLPPLPLVPPVGGGIGGDSSSGTGREAVAVGREG